MNPSLRSILDALPDAIIWAYPVFDREGTVTDFEVAFSNRLADKITQHPRGALQGLRIRKDGVPSYAAAESNFRHFLDVYHTKEAKEYTYHTHVSDQPIETCRIWLEGGVLSTTHDRSAQRETEKKEQERTALLHGIIEHAPVGIALYEAIRDQRGEITDFQVKLYNQTIHQLSGFSEAERCCLTFRELLRTDDSEETFERHKTLVETGEPIAFEFYSSRVKRWLYFRVIKLGNGFLTLLSDQNDIKVAQQTAEQASQFSTSILNASLNGIYVLEAISGEQGVEDFRFITCNQKFADLTGWPVEHITGKRFLSQFPHTRETGMFHLLCQVIESGEPHRQATYYAQAFGRWYDAMLVRLGENKVVVTYQDISKQREAAIQLERQRNLLDKILQHSPAGISVTEVIRDSSGNIIDGRSVLANDPAIRYIGLPKEAALTKTIKEIDPAILAGPLYQMALRTLVTGEPFHTQYFFEPTKRWLELSVSKMDDDHLINIFTDVTTTKQAQLEVEQSMQRLEAVFNAAQSGMFTFSPVHDETGEIVDFRFVITNTNFAAYVGKTPQVLNGELGSTWFPGYLHNGLFDMYKTTFLTGKTQCQDVHYYADGLDLYLDLMSTKIGDEVLVTFTDYTLLKKAQLQLEKHVAELERSNRNLEEFAHAASHDLKEPVRKIQVFSDLLKNSFASLSSEQQHLFAKVEYATKRMAMLIHDLLEYSHINMGLDLVEEINLNKKVALVLGDLEVSIQEKQATITVGDLPIVRGHRRQLQQVFHNLIQNALKYSKSDVAPVITITAEEVTGKTSTFDLPEEENGRRFHLIQVRDNGIGFNQEHAELIFQVFKRLHGKGVYSGSGVGLAIVRKVVENHRGYIKAESELYKGANFKILLPV